MSDSQQDKPSDKQDRWKMIASLLGAAVPEEPAESNVPEADATLPAADKPVSPSAERPKAKPAQAAQAPSDWNTLCGQLGIEVAPVPAATEAPQPPAKVWQKPIEWSPPREPDPISDESAERDPALSFFDPDAALEVDTVDAELDVPPVLEAEMDDAAFEEEVDSESADDRATIASGDATTGAAVVVDAADAVERRSEKKRPMPMNWPRPMPKSMTRTNPTSRQCRPTMRTPAKNERNRPVRRNGDAGHVAVVAARLVARKFARKSRQKRMTRSTSLMRTMTKRMTSSSMIMTMTTTRRTRTKSSRRFATGVAGRDQRRATRPVAVAKERDAASTRKSRPGKRPWRSSCRPTWNRGVATAIPERAGRVAPDVAAAVRTIAAKQENLPESPRFLRRSLLVAGLPATLCSFLT